MASQSSKAPVDLTLSEEEVHEEVDRRSATPHVTVRAQVIDLTDIDDEAPAHAASSSALVGPGKHTGPR